MIPNERRIPRIDSNFESFVKIRTKKGNHGDAERGYIRQVSVKLILFAKY